MFSDCRRGQSPGLAEQRHVVRNGRKRCSVFRPNKARWERPEIRLIDAVIEAYTLSRDIEMSDPSQGGLKSSAPMSA